MSLQTRPRGHSTRHGTQGEGAGGSACGAVARGKGSAAVLCGRRIRAGGSARLALGAGRYEQAKQQGLQVDLTSTRPQFQGHGQCRVCASPLVAVAAAEIALRVGAQLASKRACASGMVHSGQDGRRGSVPWCHLCTRRHLIWKAPATPQTVLQPLARLTIHPWLDCDSSRILVSPALVLSDKSKHACAFRQ